MAGVLSKKWKTIKRHMGYIKDEPGRGDSVSQLLTKKQLSHTGLKPGDPGYSLATKWSRYESYKIYLGLCDERTQSQPSNNFTRATNEGQPDQE